MRKVFFALLGISLAACQAAPVPPTTGAPAGAGPAELASAPPLAALVEPLAHEGGIVFLKPFTAIADPTRQAAATLLGVELAAALRAERAMRDAGLLAGTAMPGSYLLAASGPGGGSGSSGSGRGGPTALASGSHENEVEVELELAEPSARPGPSASPSEKSGSSSGPGPQPTPGASASPWVTAVQPSGDPGSRVHEVERTEADLALAAWQGLEPGEREAAEAVHERRDRDLREREAPQLALKARTFQRTGADALAASPGFKTLTTTFRMAGTDRTLTVTRTFDPQGSLVQSLETLVGTMDGIGFDCERARTLKPDGTEAIAVDSRLRIGGKVHAVRWAKQVAADGSRTGTGAILRPDGTAMLLSSSATADLLESIAGKDAAGVDLHVDADGARSTATATFDAGAAGSAELQIDVDHLPDN